MFVAIDRTSKFVFVELHEKATTAVSREFLLRLIAAVAYKNDAPCKRNRPFKTGTFNRLQLCKPMLGMLPPNFRQVTLDHDGGQWLITFVLEREDAEDQEEIEDFGSEWGALQSGPEQGDVRTVVTSEALSWPSSPTRVLYLRREAASAQS